MTIRRIFTHLLTTAAHGRKAFPDTTLAAIEAAIAAGERQHRAEVCVMVEHSLPLPAVLRQTTSRQRAVELFARYRVWDTKESCGVLLYANLADRKVEIVADHGVSALVDSARWRDICQTLTRGFAQQEFHHSMLAALAQLNALLQAHYPADGAHANQLPDKPILL